VLSEVENDVRACSQEQNGLKRKAEELRVELDMQVQARGLP
jgi:hypothetical protein